MLFHPDQFALYNARSRAAFDLLQLNTSSLEAFEDDAVKLKEHLGAADFLELDLFLWLLQGGQLPVDGTLRAPRFWWVNQSETYGSERDGGYLWASGAGKAGWVYAHWVHMTELRPGDAVLHYANGSIQAVGLVRQGATRAPRPAEESYDAAGEEGYLVPVEYHELHPPIPLKEVPLEWRVAGDGPFAFQGGVKQRYLFPLPGGFVRRLTEHFDRDWPDFLEELVDGTDDEPEPPSAPTKRRIVKIAPGPRAMYWDGCLAEGYVCVGWDEVGDLRTFPTKEAFVAAFRER